MVRTLGSKSLGAEIVRTSVEVWGSMEGGVELAEGVEFRHICGGSNEGGPTSAIFPMEVFFKLWGWHIGFS